MPEINKTVAQAVVRRLSMQPLLTVPDSGIDMDMARFLAMTPEEKSEEEGVYGTWKSEVVASFGMAPNTQDKPFAFSNGVAVIPIHGMLVNRFGGSWGWITGYTYLSRMTLVADADPDVKLIVYDVNSGGGEVAGCAEAAKIIASTEKPTMAIIDTRCYSAAYWLASQADKIMSTQSGGAGSIGAMAIHMDYSDMLAQDGIKVTLMSAGKHKTDGSPYKELDADVKAKIEARLEETRQEFAQTVAEGRNIPLESVLATEADCYTAQQAVDLKLIDKISDPSAAILTAMARLDEGNDPFDEDEEDDMTTAANATKPATVANEQAAVVDPKQIEQESRARMKTINTHANASAQSGLASFLAYDTDLTAEMCCAILDKIIVPEAAPKAETETPNPNAATTTTTTKAESQGADAFAAAMDATKNPNIKPNQQDKAEVSQLDDVLALIPAEMLNK